MHIAICQLICGIVENKFFNKFKDLFFNPSSLYMDDKRYSISELFF